MFHFFGAITNKKGDALPGYYVRLTDANGNGVSLYSDGNGTPIINASGIADAAKVDDNGNASFYVQPGEYNLNVYAADASTLYQTISSIPMGLNTITLASGSAASTRSQLADIELPVAGQSALLTESGREGMFVFDSADHSADVAGDSDQAIYVAPSSDPTGASGAWVRKFTGQVSPQWFGAAPEADSALTDFLDLEIKWQRSRGGLSLRRDIPTSPSDPGWALLKLGILDGTEDGWINNPGLPDNVCLWTLVNSANGRSSIWGANFAAEVLAVNDATAWGIEVDMNQNGSVVTDPSAPLKKVGVDCVSAGPNNATVAYRASSQHTDSTGLWHIGYYADRCASVGFQVSRAAGDTGTQFAEAGFLDNSNSTTAFLCNGGTHNYGLDLDGANFSIAAIRIPNGKSINGRNAADTSDVSLLSINGSDFVTVGASGGSGVILGQNVAVITTNGIGYANGNGGTVTQATSKSTAVTLNKVCGAIALNNAALAANTVVTFTLNNNTITADDDLHVWVKSGNATAGSYRVAAEGSASGARTIVVENKTAGPLSEAIVLGFSVIKAVVS